jgi:anaerobic ribonucleoside-triphosphate reductase activating protein
MISVLKIIEDTTVDGPGFRTAIYCAGCAHHCPGCHNPSSWEFNAGKTMSTEEIMEVIEADPFAHVTFTGGDPMYQAEGFAELAASIKTRTDKTIWCYTGFLFEELLANETRHKLLEQIDVLVDGPFEEDKKDTDLLFRGSSNQRLIDVKASLQTGKVTLWER